MTRTMRVEVGKLVGEHEFRTADRHLRMTDLAVRTIEAHHLAGAEGRLVEGNGARGAIDDDIGRQAVIALGYVSRLGGHGRLLSHPLILATAGGGGIVKN